MIGTFKEVGITNSQLTNTYEYCKKINIDTLLKHFHDLFRYFRISVSEDNKHLPSIYWLPKLHKNPTNIDLLLQLQRVL